MSSRVIDKFFFLFVILVSSTLLCNGHEMCADDQQLMKMKSPLKFCSISSEYSCCTKQYENAIRIKYNDIRYQFPVSLEKKCSPYIKEMLCHLCHPMSSHSFESDAKWEIPGLCPNYCQKFYTDCHEIIKYLGENVYNLYLEGQSEGSSSWCEKVQTFDKDYCFPEVKTNKKLTSERSLLTIKSNSEKCVCFKNFEEFKGETILPVKMQEIDDDSGRLFVAELPGLISVFHPNGTKENVPFLNITDRISRQGKNKEKGLMSFIFHPSFKSNGKIYVIYAAKGKHSTQLHEFTMTSNFSIEKERVLIKVIPPGQWHNLDDVIFGYDGYLYVFNGDGGVQGDYFNLAQNSSVLFGKALRIDVDNISDEKPYAIPPDNPFIEDAAFAPEIYAYGLRNPWRCTLDTGDPITGENKGRILCGDVGQGGVEEIDIIKKGRNYGWKKKEGYGCFRSEQCDDIPHEELPIHSYPTAKGSLSPVVRYTEDNVYPIYKENTSLLIICLESASMSSSAIMSGRDNKNFYCQEKKVPWFMNTLTENDDGSWSADDLEVCNQCPSSLTNKIPTHVMSFGRDSKGEVYVLTTTKEGVYETLPGYIYKIVHPDTYEWCPHLSKGKESDDKVKKHDNDDKEQAELLSKSNHDEQTQTLTSASESFELLPIQQEQSLINAAELSTSIPLKDHLVHAQQDASDIIFSSKNTEIISSSTSHMTTTSSMYMKEVSSSYDDMAAGIFIADQKTFSLIEDKISNSEESSNKMENNVPIRVIVPTPTLKGAMNEGGLNQGTKLNQEDSQLGQKEEHVQNNDRISENVVANADNGSNSPTFLIQSLLTLLLISYLMNKI